MCRACEGLSLVQRHSGRTEWVFMGAFDEAAAPPFVVGGVEHKGLGAYASRAIAQGELIIAEAPLVMHALPPGDELVPGGQASSEATASEVEALIAGLSTAKRAAFFELCGGRSAHQIWKENAFRILDQDDGAFIAVFARIARINHSCAPNCYSTFNDEAKRQAVRALRAIARGEELHICYTGSQAAGMARDARRALLRRRWGFACACAACGLEGGALAASDARRTRIAALGARIEADATEEGAVGGLAEEQLALMGAEGLPEVWATNSLLRASLVANRQGDEEGAARWWLRMHAAMRTALGVRPDDPLAQALST